MTDAGQHAPLAERLQTLLFVPGTRPDRFGRALDSGADAVCIDLEDAVPAADKADARKAALAALGDPRLVLRVNGSGTAAGAADLAALAAAPSRPALLLLPKVENAAELSAAAALGVPLVPLIETPRGLRHAHEIGAAAGVAAMMFGGGDLSAELGVDLGWEPLATARGLFVLACAEAGVPAIDVPYLHLDDAAGLIEETRRARAIGFSAKAAIHPQQIATIHEVLRPTAAEIAEALEAEQVFQAAGGAAVRFRGRLLEAPVMRRYRRILDQGRHACVTE